MNNIQRTSTTAYKVSMASIMAALALIFSYIEAIIPFNMGIPGVKLGIANLVIIISLYTLGFGYTMAINIIRILVSGLLFNGLFGALYSLAGGILSLVVMLLLKKTKLFSMIGVSMGGGVAHNLGQVLTAAFLVSNIKMFLYFPILLFSGVISGIIIGIVSYYILKKLPIKGPAA